MTSEEIKQRYLMTDVLSRYGMQPNRAGFISCPFHRERTASMKIYKDSYYCFGCGANGDIFTFIEGYEGVSFRDAFHSLGGTYKKPSFSSNLAIYRVNKRREAEQKRIRRLSKERQKNNLLIGVYRRGIQVSSPLSDAWRENYNALQYQLYVHSELNEI